jgi:23S rRNA (pseudouridine1915-N3)-methyltransferase
VHIRLLAVGDRQPSWVNEAFGIYAERFPRQAMTAEGEQILARLGATEQVVLLDEQGKQLTSQLLAARLKDWQTDGRDLCFVIGGPDGVSDNCRQRANFTWSLSQLTLPHGLARVLFAEQMFRAWSLQTGHPYHRE